MSTCIRDANGSGMEGMCSIMRCVTCKAASSGLLNVNLVEELRILIGEQST